MLSPSSGERKAVLIQYWVVTDWHLMTENSTLMHSIVRVKVAVMRTCLVEKQLLDCGSWTVSRR